MNFHIKEPKVLLFKILIIFIPVYLIAYFTQNMVYILPTLAIGIMFGTSLNEASKKDDGEMDSDPSDWVINLCIYQNQNYKNINNVKNIFG